MRVDIVTVRRLVNRGELPAYRIGNEYRFTRVDLEEFIKRQRVTPGENTKFEPFKHFTERARQVMVLAENEAQRLEHHYIGTEHMPEHLLLDILREGGGLAVDVMKDLGVDLEKVRNETLRMLQQIAGDGKEKLQEDK